MTGTCWCPVSSARSVQKFGRKNKKKKKNKNMKRWKRGNSDYDTFLSCELQVALGSIVALCTLKEAYPWPWIVPVHHRFASFANMPNTNTLDRSRHFEPGTFLNRHHYRDVWWMHNNDDIVVSIYKGKWTSCSPLCCANWIAVNSCPVIFISLKYRPVFAIYCFTTLTKAH